MAGSILERVKGLVLPRPGRRFVALDLDSRYLRMVHAERAGDRLRILRLATFPVPEGVDVSDVEALGTFIGRCLGEPSLKSGSVLMSVPRSQAILKAVSLPPAVKESELAGMVQYQMETELPFPAEGAAIDFTVESHFDAATPTEEASGPGVNVLVAAVQRPVIEQYQRLAEIAGVRLLRLGLRPYADARCVEACTIHHAKECTAVVHVGADETEIDILLGGATVFSRSAVVKVPPPGEESDSTAEQAVDGVAVEVARSLRSYQAVQRGRGIDSLLVAGGTGIEAQVASELARRLGIPCKMFDPSRALRLDPNEKDPSAFISALGLAIGHAGVAELPFDFLNPKRPPVQRDMRKILAGVIGGSVAAVFVAGVVAGVLFLKAKQSRVDGLSEVCKRLEEKNRSVAALAKPVGAVETWVGAGRPWLDHWAFLSAVPAVHGGVCHGAEREPGRRVEFLGEGAFERGDHGTRPAPGGRGVRFSTGPGDDAERSARVHLHRKHEGGGEGGPEGGPDGGERGAAPEDDVSGKPDEWPRALRRGSSAPAARPTSTESPSVPVRRPRGSSRRGGGE